MQRGKKRAEARRKRHKAERRRTPRRNEQTRLEHQSRMLQLKQVMKKYDTDSSGNLNREQLRSVMQQMNQDRGDSHQVTEEEVDWLMRRGDTHHTGGIEIEELHQTILWYDTYGKYRDRVNEDLRNFDDNKSGQIDAPELRKLMIKWRDMIDAEDDEEVPLEDAQGLLAECDESRTGGLSLVELSFAAIVYFAQWDDSIAQPTSTATVYAEKKPARPAGSKASAHPLPAHNKQSGDSCQCAVQ